MLWRSVGAVKILVFSVFVEVGLMTSKVHHPRVLVTTWYLTAFSKKKFNSRHPGPGHGAHEVSLSAHRSKEWMLSG